MKKTLLIAALTLASATAFGSKARKASVSHSVTLANDVQDYWTNAGKMMNGGDMLTFEFGGAAATPATATFAAATTAGTPGSFTAWENTAIAEGGFFKSNGDSKWGVYFGHRSSAMDSVKWAAGYSTAQLVLTPYTPFALFYGMKSGDIAWAAALSYYSAKATTTAPTETKAEGQALRLGAVASNWEAYANLGLSSKDTLAVGTEFKGDMSMQIGGQMNMGDDMVVYAEMNSASGKLTAAAVDTKGTLSETMVGIERKMKSDSSHIFYGAKYKMMTLKNDLAAGEQKFDSTTLPVYFGIEADAASWLTLRGQVSKAMMIDTSKAVNGAAEIKGEGTGATTVAFGGSWKFNKSSVDFNATVATAGALGLGTFGSNASYTYNF